MKMIMMMMAMVKQLLPLLLPKSWSWGSWCHQLCSSKVVAEAYPATIAPPKVWVQVPATTTVVPQKVGAEVDDTTASPKIVTNSKIIQNIAHITLCDNYAVLKYSVLQKIQNCAQV